jgi:amidohydrolase
MDLISPIASKSDDFVRLRRQLHSHPELAFEEYVTADLIAAKLLEWDIPLDRQIGKTGVVGTIKRGNSSRAIGLRAEIDALPIQELNKFCYASKVPGRMHACGHDGHVVMLLAAAQYLSKEANFNGTIYLIFQPAEEAGAGARAMVQDGLFDRFSMEAVFGMHNCPETPVGTFRVRTGPILAASSDFRLLIRGKGTHAAMPHKGVDPLPVACQIVQSFYTALSRTVDPSQSAVLSVTSIRGGTVINAISDTCEVSGTLRTFDELLMQSIEQRMQQIAQHTCLAFNAACEFECQHDYPATVNDRRLSAIAAKVMASVVGKPRVIGHERMLGAEDFAYMSSAKPGCYCFIGSGRTPTVSNTVYGMLHTDTYDFNDEVIPIGATYWVRLAEACLPET